MLTFDSAILLTCALILTILLVIVGIYVIGVLRELKHSLKTANQILAHGNEITSALKEPILTATEFYSGLREGLQVFQRFVKPKKTP